MTPIPLESIADYLGRLTALPHGTDRDDFFAFRGQSKDWLCLPTITRPPYTGKAIYTDVDKLPKPAEYRFFMRFRDTTIPYQPAWVQVSSPSESSWRQLILAQHYGLPTRLLDWTTKPLVALYFAVEEEKHWNAEGVIHVLPSNIKRVFTVSALARENQNPPLYSYSDQLGVLWPPDIASRVTAQGSLFTIGKDPLIPVSERPTFVVPPNKKEIILDELRKLGITRGHLFPDIDGLTRAIKEEANAWDEAVK